MNLILAAMVWLLIYALVFSPFFTGETVGGDYVYFLPKLLDEYIYSSNNGWFSPQWFTPSFCGGFTGLANPQSTYWSLPHLLTYFTNPVLSALLTMVIFASIGGIGFYLFANMFHSGWAALVAALLFASNGYHVARMLEGHLGHHGLMLIPVISWLIVHNHASLTRREPWLGIVLAGCALAYLILAAGGPIMPQAIAGIVMFLSYSALRGRMTLRESLGRLLIAGTIAALLVGPILLATGSFMVNNPREWLPLPQFETLGGAMLHGLEIIVSPFRDTDRLHESLIHTGTRYEWHEFEYGLTFMPIALIAAASLAYVTRKSHGEVASTAPGRRVIPSLVLFTLLFTMPFFLNTTLGPLDKEALRSIPILGSTSTLMRWFLLTMLGMALISTLLADYFLSRMKNQGQTGALLAVATLIVIPLHYQLGINQEMNNRRVQYDATNITNAYRDFSVDPRHAIVSIGARTDIFRNESFLDGASAQYCYEAALGYRLEGLIITTVAGPISLIKDDRYNMLDPACFVYPYENRCHPGSRFDTGADDERIRHLANYQPMTFAAPRLHHSLALLSRLTIIVVAAVICLSLLGRWRRHR